MQVTYEAVRRYYPKASTRSIRVLRAEVGKDASKYVDMRNMLATSELLARFIEANESCSPAYANLITELCCY